jgi:hypothetical protein
MSVDMPAALSGPLLEASPRRIGTPLISMVGPALVALAAQQIIHSFVKQAAHALPIGMTSFLVVV